MGGIQAGGLPGPQCHPGPSDCHEDSCPGVPLELWVPHSGTPRAGLAKLPGWDQDLGTELCTPVSCHIRVTQPSLALLPGVLRPRQLSVCPTLGRRDSFLHCHLCRALHPALHITGSSSGISGLVPSVLTLLPCAGSRSYPA